MKVYREGAVWSVVPVVPFVSMDEPIHTHHSPHGQQVSIFGNDPDDPRSVGQPVSRVNINAQCQRGPDTFPFTGRNIQKERFR